MNLASTSVRRGHLRGFTLIELLVVIAIIGILSSVVLASLNTARNKGADAAIKSNLSAARAEAEIYYDTNSNSYGGGVSVTGGAGVCQNSASVANNIGDSVQAAITASGDGTLATRCYASNTVWAAHVRMKSNTAEYYCVDSTGYAATTTSATASSDGVCP